MASVSILAIDRPREPASERANPPGGVYEGTDDHSRAAPPSPLRHRARHRRHKHALAPCIGAQRWIQAQFNKAVLRRPLEPGPLDSINSTVRAVNSGVQLLRSYRGIGASLWAT